MYVVSIVITVLCLGMTIIAWTLV